MTTGRKVDSGLEGIVVAESALSRVDGEGGRLILRGHDITDFAERASYEQACALLWEGFDPAEATHRVYAVRLAAARVAAFARLEASATALHKRDGMDALRGALALLDSESDGYGSDEVARAFAITGAAAVFAAAASRLRRGLPPIAPDPTLGHAADYLRMSRGRDDPAAARGARRATSSPSSITA